ncbi:MAG TPA: FkbM family methyltransferase [Candidatus Acidoferrum sp.]|nr:FkbM family methyltransferase [Candidatus Acidoferrum sp.]
MSLKNLFRDLTPNGILEYRRAHNLCRKYELKPRAGISTRTAARAARLSGATLFRPEWLPGLAKIIDVGANVGQWAEFWQSVNRPEQILSIEPNPESFRKLLEKSAKQQGWTCVNLAAGDQPGTLSFNVPSDSTSASLLGVKAKEGWEDPDCVANPKRISVNVERVDELASDWPEISLLKVDAEGYECHVLRGAQGTLRRTSFILVELTWFERFESGATAWTIHDFLSQNDFVLWGVGDSTTYNGRSVFCDALFVNKRVLEK